MSFPTASVRCFNCRKDGIIEVFGPSREIELPSGWVFLIYSHHYWRPVEHLLNTEAFAYVEDIRLFCSPPCASAFIESQVVK